MRVFIIRLIALLVILWAAFQPGAALNPNPAPAAKTAENTVQPAAVTLAPGSTVTLPAPSPTFTATSEPTSPAVTPVATSPVDGSEAIRFAVIGDYGSEGRGEKAVAEMVISWQPDFIITTGDNNYSVGAKVTIDRNIGQYYHEFIYPYVGEYGEGASFNRFFPTLGNHDWHTSKAKPHLDYFKLPGNERYYDFVWGPVHFFALDSDPREPDGIKSESEQADWLHAALAASTSPWKIVYMHHPPYSSSDAHGSDERLQWPFKEWGASAILSGHDHVYERIVQDGFPYFVNGLGGVSSYQFDSPVEGSELRFRENFGAMLVEASADAIIFEFYALDGGDSTLIDSYTITH